MSSANTTHRPTPLERAEGLLKIIEIADLWPEAIEELQESAKLLMKLNEIERIWGRPLDV